MNWQWLLSPGQPRPHWIAMTAIMTFVLMFITRPFWLVGGAAVAANAAMFAVAISAISSKMILEMMNRK